MYYDVQYLESVKMSDWEYLTLERDNRVLVVSFDSANQINSLNIKLMRELTSLAIELQQDNELSAIILRGNDTMFTGGMNLKDSEILTARDGTVAEERILAKVGSSMCAAWEALDLITIVAIEGWCIGGGVALAVACDWRVAGSDAKIYVPELKLGMNMSWQTVPRAIALMGPAKTKRIFILSEQLNATKGLDWGYVDKIARNGKALEAAMQMAKRIAEMPPVHVRMIKQGINAAAFALSDAVSSLDRDQYLLALNSDDASEGLQSFLEKRPPQYKGR